MKKQTFSFFVGIIFLLGSVRVACAVDYTYDALNRLTKVTYDNGASIAYGYDAAGNRLTLVSKGGTTPVQLLAAAMVGVALETPLPALFAGAENVTVKGLPAGLTYDAARKLITGVASKAGSFNVVISATGLTPQTMAITVEALPAWAQGTFNGYVEGGSATMTVTAAGKVTGKISIDGMIYTFSVASYATGGSGNEGFEIETTAKAGKVVELPLTLLLKQAIIPQALGVAAGALGDGLKITLYRNVWKTEGVTLAPFIGYFTATLPGDAEYGSGYLTFTVDKAGKVKTAGKLADGTAVSLSGTLIMDATGGVFTVVYVAPTTYKGGCLFGLAEIVQPDVGEVYLRPRNGEAFVWKNASPQATGAYGEGFERTTGLAGGWYSKTGDLGAYYAGRDLTVGTDTNAALPELTVGTVRYDSVCWNPSGIVLTPTFKSGAMAGLSAPAAGKPTDADKDGEWDYSAANSVGLKIGLTRATGIFKGSFLAWFDYPDKKHVSKSLAFEGALTPVREDMEDGVAGRGYFLWADKSLTPVYTFSWSYDFEIMLSDPDEEE